jgi:hypothetical protein
MKNKLISHLFTCLVLGCFAISTASAQQEPPVIKATVSGYPTFVCSAASNLPMGTAGGLVTMVKTSDNIDQKLTTDMQGSTLISAMDLVYYQKSGNGQLTKTQTLHFTKLLVKSVAPGTDNVTTIGFGYDAMTKK